MIRVLVDLLLETLLGVQSDSPLGYMLLAAIALGLIALAIAMLRRPASTGPRRSATELHAVITVAAGDRQETWAFTVQARPGQTRADLLEQIRDRLPEPLRSAPITFWSIESNIVVWGTADKLGHARPAQITQAWHSSRSCGNGVDGGVDSLADGGKPAAIPTATGGDRRW